MRKTKTTFKTGKPKNKAASELMALPLCLGLIALAMPPSGRAENPAVSSRQRFNIAPQPLYSALSRLAEQSGVQFVYDAEMVKDLDSPGVYGNYSTAAALARLLAGSGIDYRIGNGGVVTLKNYLIPVAAKTESAPPSVTALATVKVTEKTEYSDDDPYVPTYNHQNSFTATKTDTPIFDTPVSIQVVPKAVMEDQKSFRIKDALENVSGVRAQPSLGFGTGFIVRGFRSDRVFRNGLLSTREFFPSEFDVATLESIEVLKGPAAVLFGRTEPGGLINATTKKPLDVPFHSLEQQFGSYDHYRTEWDATGPVNNDHSLLYRFAGSYQNNNSFRDFIFNDRVTVSPTITWRPSDKTDLTLNVEGVEQEFQADFGIPVLGKRPAPIPVSRSFSDPNDPIDHLSKVYLGTEFNHRFNDDWAIHNRFLASRLHTDSTFVNPAPAFDSALQADGRTLGRNIFSQEDDVESYSTNLDLTGKFQLAGTKHETLVGFDFLRAYTSYHVQGDWVNPNPDLAIDIYNPGPSYGIDPDLFNTTLASYVFPGREYSMFKDEWYGAYFQDHITLWDKLHIMGGGRYDWAETGRGRASTLAEATNAVDNSSPSILRKDEGFSPRVGILYQHWDWLGIYGNWTTSFGANNGVSSTGATFEPERGEQFEAGIKTQLFDKKLSATLAYYHLIKQNILTSDLTTADPTDSAAIGEARSEGVEFDISGQLTKDLSIIASYAYTDARITKNNDGYQGTRLPNVAEHGGSLWLKYDFNNYEPLRGFSVGFGGVAAGEREGNYAYYGHPFQLPGYVRVDAFAAYKLLIKKTPVTAQINIRNLLDKTYYESTDPDSNVSPQNGVYPGAPLMAVGSIKVEF